MYSYLSKIWIRIRINVKSEIRIHPDPLPWAADSPCAILYIRTVLATNTRKTVFLTEEEKE